MEVLFHSLAFPIPYLEGTTFHKLETPVRKKCTEHFFSKTCFLVLIISVPADVQLLASVPGCILGRKKKSTTYT